MTATLRVPPASVDRCLSRDDKWDRGIAPRGLAEGSDDPACSSPGVEWKEGAKRNAHEEGDRSRDVSHEHGASLEQASGSAAPRTDSPGARRAYPIAFVEYIHIRLDAIGAPDGELGFVD